MSALIEVDCISKSYLSAGQVVSALRDVTMHIPQGEVYGIIGVSGAGKSTLIRALAGLVTPSSGKIFFHGQDIVCATKQEKRQYHQKIGMIFQHFNLLYSRTVAENIRYPLEIAHVPLEEQNLRVDELLGLVGLSEKRDSYPSQLSGGEKQRVGIARALANRPELLLCDEATSALDPKTTNDILTLLKSINLKLGVTIVLITHEMDVIKQICHRVAVLEKGTIAEEGPVSQIFADPQHVTTQTFLQNASHAIPPEFFKEISPRRKLLRLRFKGQVAGEPIMSEIVRKFNVDTNILLGWIDRLQTTIIGTLIIELRGSPEDIQNVLGYLEQKKIQFEVLENAL